MHADPVQGDYSVDAVQGGGVMIDQTPKTAQVVTLEQYLDEHERMLSCEFERLELLVGRLTERLITVLGPDYPREGPFALVDDGPRDTPEDRRSPMCQRVDSLNVRSHANLALIFHRLNVLADRIEV